MGWLDPHKKLMREIHAGIHDVVVESIKRNDFKILDFNRDKQLAEKGEDAKGDQLGTYSNGWKRIRISRGLQVQYVDTRFTGKFHATLKLVVENDQFKIVSQVDYADDIIKKYGADVLGLQQKYLEEIVNTMIIPDIKQMINDKFSRFNG